MSNARLIRRCDLMSRTCPDFPNHIPGWYPVESRHYAPTCVRSTAMRCVHRARSPQVPPLRGLVRQTAIELTVNLLRAGGTVDLTNITAFSFDCYGTLIDWESGIVAALQPWLARNRLDMDREDLLAYFGAIETVVESEQPGLRYPLVLAETLRRIAAKLNVEATAAECADFGASVPDWPAFPDSAAALARLQQRFKLIILSNVDRASFAASNRKLSVAFDLVITAEDVGSYKPDQRNFDRLFSEIGSIGVERAQLVHVAESLFHDHGPAQRNNLPSVWIHRRHGRSGSGATASPTGVREPTWRFPSMAAFADAALEPGAESS